MITGKKKFLSILSGYKKYNRTKIRAVLWNEKAIKIKNKNFKNFLSIIYGIENKHMATAILCRKINREL